MDTEKQKEGIKNKTNQKLLATIGILSNNVTFTLRIVEKYSKNIFVHDGTYPQVHREIKERIFSNTNVELLNSGIQNQETQ